MTKFVEKSNLPQNKVVLAAISAEAGEAIAKLNALGVETVKIPCRPEFAEPVRSHADLQIFHAGNDILYSCCERLFEKGMAKKFQIRKIASPPRGNYPDDVRLNCALIGDKLVCNANCAAPEILDFAEGQGFKIVNVKQGYSKCSICVVGENAVITDDESVFKAAAKFFDDAVRVSKGSVELIGYEYGFIGGCCGKIDKNKIAFNGSIETHKDYKVILDCLSRNGAEAVELRKGRLRDIGGILPLREET